MKKILFHLPLSLLSVLLLVSSCQKEGKQLNDTTNEVTGTRSGDAGGCQMTLYDYYDGIADFHNYDVLRYKNGLVDEMDVNWGATFKIHYDVNGKMKASDMYFGPDLMYNIHFVRKNNRIVKETWYVANTETIDDIVEHTYNERGQMMKTVSLYYDYYTDYTWARDGELESWFFVLGGLPNAKAEYESGAHYKNPWLSATGVEHQFGYANPAVFTRRWWYGKEKVTLFDENGDSFVYYDSDPAQTVWTPAQQGYPQMAVYPVLGTNAVISTSFEYENCSPGESSVTARLNTNSNATTTRVASRKLSLAGAPNPERIQEILKMRKSNVGSGH